MSKLRGLYLASTAIQKGNLSALASSTDTSWKSADFTGRSDKTPVLHQNLPEQERSPIRAVLPWPRVHLCTTHQEPDIDSGGRVATVSLRRGQPCQWLYHFTTECLLTSRHILAQRLCPCKAFLYLRTARRSSPRLKSGASRRALVSRRTTITLREEQRHARTHYDTNRCSTRCF
jgi:hypothetical protein